MARVGVALSGGVDSSVAAFLLLKEGHEVIGFSLRLGHGPDKAWQMGAEAAGVLGIAHHTVDVSREFKRRVLEPVVTAYSGGKTPNPCALCNAGVKFPLLWERAVKEGCEVLATGHYARLVRVGARLLLAEGRDLKKSQAYFLARLGPEMLDRLQFPLGELDKPQVRKMAKHYGLPASKRPESQDVCFLPAGGWDQLMAAYSSVRGGPMEDVQGRRLGSHEGLHRFTVGQRRGLGVALGRPHYVVALDGPRAAVKVGTQEQLWSRGLWGEDVLWHLPPDECEDLSVRIRYAHAGVGCRIHYEKGKLRIEFAKPQKAVAPGQMAVLFHQDMVVGSAWIEKAIY